MTTELTPPPVIPEGDTGRPILLRRSKTDRVVGGVAGGLGRYLGIDPVIIRVAFVLLAISGGSGVLLYLIGWVAIPEEREGDPVGKSPHGDGVTGRLLVGGTIMVVGSILLVATIFPAIDQFLWPIAVVAVGAFIVMGGRR